MLRFIALIISITLQFTAAIIALRLIRITRYRLSWILISSGLLLMALRRLINLVPFFTNQLSDELYITYDWLGVIISFLITAGVILIGEIFYSLKRAELERKRSDRRMLSAILATEEKERQRFAKDLHDGLGPILSTIKMSVSALDKRQAGQINLEILQNVEKAVDEAVLSIRELSNNLSPHVLKSFGLVSAIHSFINKFEATKSIKVDFTTNMEDIRLDEHHEIILYRGVCELLTNTLRHAKAKTVQIELLKIDRQVSLHYSDDGRGFDAEFVREGSTGGSGLANILHRVSTANGVFQYQSEPGSGMSALIRLGN